MIAQDRLLHLKDLNLNLSKSFIGSLNLTTRRCYTVLGKIRQLCFI